MFLYLRLDRYSSISFSSIADSFKIFDSVRLETISSMYASNILEVEFPRVSRGNVVSMLFFTVITLRVVSVKRIFISFQRSQVFNSNMLKNLKNVDRM